jgi:tripartite-type tricarboxylate transporter receptor subunit TctC
VQTMNDIFEKDLITGSVGAGSSTSIVPTVLNRVLGTRFKIIEGYRGAQDVILAMERGEVQGGCMSFGQFRTHLQLFKDGKLRFLLRAEESPIPEAPDIPSVYARVKTDEQRHLMRFFFSSTEFGRPYLFPPGVPKDRVLFMRDVIKKAATDKDLLAEAAKLKLDMTYRDPEHLEQLVAQLYSMPPDILETIKKISPNLK